MKEINLIAIAIPFFFLLIGLEALVARGMRREVYRFNDAITDLSCGISSRVTGVFVGIVAVLPYTWLYEHARFATLDKGSVATHLIAFLGVDLAYYLWHRFTHEVNIGWATHVVHHQSEDYNLAVALRQSITSPLTSWLFHLPLALIGVPPIVMLTHSALNTLYQFWIHTELINKLGPLEWIINTPSHHRVHHAINPRYLDKNYAGVLIIWDRMFGTFEPEVEPCVYGTVEPLRSFDPLWANAWWGVGLARDALAAPNLSQALYTFVARPGWRPDGLPKHPSPAPISPKTAPPKYDPSGPPGLVPYVLSQFVPVTLATTAAIWFENAIWEGPTAIAWQGAALVVVCATLWTWGALFERHPHALFIENIRLSLLPALALVGWMTGAIPSWVPAAVGLFSSLSAIYLTKITR